MTDPQTGQEKPPTPEKVAVETDADEDIPHPTFEVYRNTLLRGANLGGVLSLVLGPPVLFVCGVMHIQHACVVSHANEQAWCKVYWDNFIL